MKKTKKCYSYSDCKYTKCGDFLGMPSCRPSYCYDDKNKSVFAKNWLNCNMLNWKHLKKNKKRYSELKQKCIEELFKKQKCKKGKTKKINKTSVDALELHSKMPYIWRFLKPQTRKHMVQLAKKPIHELNVHGSIFGDIRCLPKKTQKKMMKLRQKYKNI